DGRDDRVDHALSRAPVDIADDLAGRARTLVRQLVRLGEPALDAGDYVFESLGTVERSGGHQLAVVLPAHVLQSPALAGRRALVVEDTDRGPLVDARVEQDRP